MNTAESKPLREFKLRIAGIVSGKPEQIKGALRPHPLLVRGNKPATHRKSKRRTETLAHALYTFAKSGPRKDKRGATSLFLALGNRVNAN